VVADRQLSHTGFARRYEADLAGNRAATLRRRTTDRGVLTATDLLLFPPQSRGFGSTWSDSEVNDFCK
jgi:hypothetical protein